MGEDLAAFKKRIREFIELSIQKIIENLSTNSWYWENVTFIAHHYEVASPKVEDHHTVDDGANLFEQAATSKNLP